MPQDPRALLERLVAELVTASLDGGTLTDDLERACREHPDLADDLRERMHTHAWLEELAAREPLRIAPGQVYGDYRIERLLGEGGMGRVYLATQRSLERRVAIKIAAMPGERARERMQVEARALARVRHPDVASVLAFEWLGEHPALVIEYVSGCTLQQHLRRGRERDLERVRAGAIRIARALHACHAQGVIHRDVKPSNVLLDEHLAPRLTDFGLARLRGTKRLTETHAAAGTPTYMAPEVLRGEEPDERSDLWSYGILLWEWITGRVPHRHASREALLLALTQRAIPRIETIRDDVPKSLADVVAACLQRDPKRRPTSAASVADALERDPRRDEPVPSTLRNRARTGGAVLLLLVLLSWIGTWSTQVEHDSRPIRAETPSALPRWAEERIERLRSEARQESAHARFDGALAKLDEALELAPERADLVFEHADLSLRRMAVAHTPMAPDIVQAIDAMFERAIANGHATRGAFMARAFLQYYLGGSSPSELYRRGAELPLASVSDYVHSVTAERLFGTRERALELAEANLREEPGSVFSYVLLADLMILSEELAKARLVLEQGLRVQPEQDNLLARHAFVSGLQGEVEPACAAFRDLASRRPISRIGIEYYGSFLIRVERFEELNELYDGLVAEEANPEWLLNQAWARLRIGKIDEAVASLRRAMDAGPSGDVTSRVYRSVVLAYDERYQEALETLESTRGETAVHVPLGTVIPIVQAFAPQRDRRSMSFFLQRMVEIGRESIAGR
ncbi:MAG: protein kinase [Planctomycetes bacterium]|nr:protein kinase [Planctomycetota bacterium]